MIQITEYLISKEKFVTLIFIFIILTGIFSLVTAKKQAYGTTDYGAVIITAVYPGASPKDVEMKVTTKIERKLQIIDGIDDISSVSFESFSWIAVSMEDNSDYDKIKLNIQKAIDQVEDLPQECQTPQMTEISEETRPTVEIAISGSAPYSKKRSYAKLLETQLLNQKRVASVEKVGYFDREVTIEADQQKLKEYVVSIGELINAVKVRNFRISAGDLLSQQEEKKYIILSEYKNAEELGDVIIRSSIDGNRVVLSDVAVIKDGYRKPERIVNYNGTEAIQLIAVKKSHADMLTTVSDIKKVYNEFSKTLPSDVTAEIVVDYSKEITNLLYLVGQNAVVGFILVIIMLFILLHYKIAFWTAMGIPTSVFAAFSLFPLFGITIDYLSLVSIIIVLGMLVDDAIIIAENIYRLREEGLSIHNATLQGVKEVMGPVITTILTTIIAFLPILGMTGTMGKIFRPIPIVVMILLSVSLLEAFFILPVHMAHTKFTAGKNSYNVRLFSVLENIYEKVIHFLLLRNNFIHFPFEQD
jgi:multidrug efflux pump subunit AcrB